MEASRPTARRTGKVLVIALIATALLVAADLLTKAWAVENLSAEILNPRTLEVCERDAFGRLEPGRRAIEPYVIIPGFFELRYAENCGAAFGIMRTWPKPVKTGIFFVVAIGALGVLASLFVRGRGGPFLAASVPLILSGAIGNLVDRIRYGYVVDFIRFYGEMPEALRTSPEVPPYWEYPTFNVADVAISVGVIFLFVDSFLEGRREKREAAAKAAAAPSETEGSPEAT
ncbi:MAG: signal peptidase II [Myxococcales bacterium]|nr:signal peptidase II [Myxococcales bacterium]